MGPWVDAALECPWVDCPHPTKDIGQDMRHVHGKRAMFTCWGLNEIFDRPSAGAGEEEEDGGMFDDSDDDGGAAAGKAARATAKASKKGPGGLTKEQAAALSSHERRLARLQEQIAQYEAEAMEDKHWTLVGESQAARRPVNSALEVDLDWETTVKPPPQPTEEMTNDIEALIRK